MSATTALRTSTRHGIVESPVGPLTVVRDDAGLTGLYFPGHWTRPDTSAFGLRAGNAEFKDVGTQLGEYFAGRRQTFDLALAPCGDDLARRLRQLLTEIPYGETTTYGALASQLGDGTDARAVGGLVGHNPLSIVVPCHRVLGSTGKLTGYAGGLGRKRFLLELERAVPGPTPTLW